ncbi:hypothetical protein [Roseobacter sinensis]|uniref:Uncharacterized protein n=1 Tax=Roseobacter sinensis TaxID=2931391 RepID=A0ABT3BIU0_9RHOB|nr:hypothetical protein [Roseobacter sp. WL0113]MCV3273491.1 hypothetical protein [Roseobacter sp. WL0113]
MTKLPVKVLPTNDSGRLLVRLSVKYRSDIPRYGIARLTNLENRKFERVLVLGHDDDTAIFMPYDIRKALGVEKGAELQFLIEEVYWFSKIFWLLNSRDPAVHVPAWLALASVLLGALGVAIAFIR